MRIASTCWLDSQAAECDFYNSILCSTKHNTRVDLMKYQIIVLATFIYNFRVQYRLMIVLQQNSGGQ
jgi:hypothetical protein